MPRITIEQFFALVASRAETNPVVRGYRELGRRPELAAGMHANEWIPWGADVGRTTA
ncbi:MAG TPA: hypothetical protein VGB15_16930 [Longimicrobium sp.]|jgi:hypothetical protein